MSTHLFQKVALSAAILLISSHTAKAISGFDQLPLVPSTVTEFMNFNGVGQSADYATKVAVSASGRIYVYGQSVNVGVQNFLFIRCYKPDGTLLWKDERAINGFLARDLIVDSQDNVYAIARVYNGTAFSPSSNVGIMKYNSAGEAVREEMLELDYIEPLINPFWNQNLPTAAVLAPNGKIYVTGYVSNEPFGRPSIVSHPVLFAVNTAERMSLDWTSSIHLAVDNSLIVQEVPVSLAVAATGEIYEVSNYGTQGNGVTLRKVTAAGDNAWRESAKIAAFGTRRHEAVNVGVDAKGFPYVTGTVKSEDESNSEIFVAKFNPADGAIVWLKTFQFGRVNHVTTAKVLADGSIIGAGPADTGFESGIFRVSSEGKLQWEQRYSMDTADALEVDSTGNTYVVGTVASDSQFSLVKVGAGGELISVQSLPDTFPLPGEDLRPPSIAIDGAGTVYVTGHRNLTNSLPVEGQSYPIFDAVVFKVQSVGIQPPTVRFTSPVEGQAIPAGSTFPKITVEASSPVGIQRIALYSERHELLTVLTNVPYEFTVAAGADFGLVPLYAVAYDNLGYATYAKVSANVETPNYTIEFVQPAFRISETEDSVRVRAKRTRTVGDAFVTVAMTPGTASTADFNNAGNHEPFTIFFADGESVGEALITIEKDTLAEPDETFSLALSAPSAGTLGAQTTATVTIVDNDSGNANPNGTIEFSSFNYNVTEAGGVADVVVTRSQTDLPAAISYYTQPNTATEFLDYFGTLGTIQFAAGEKTKTLRMYALKDSTAENLESFYITLHHPENGAALGAKWYTLVYIQDEAGTTSPATVSFDAGSVETREDVGTLTVPVRRSGNTSGMVTVSYRTLAGTASAGSDFTAVNGVITFAAQETLKTIQIPISTDSVAESNETFSIELSSPQGATLGAHQKLAITLLGSTQQPSSGTLNTWIQSTFTAAELGNAQVSGQFADPDNDGYPNIVEYALGLDPKSANAANILKPEMTVVNGQPALQVVFTRPKGRNDLDYLFESFEKIGSQPCAACAELAVTDNGNGTETVRVRVAGSLATRSAFLLFKVALK